METIGFRSFVFATRHCYCWESAAELCASQSDNTTRREDSPPSHGFVRDNRAYAPFKIVSRYKGTQILELVTTYLPAPGVEVIKTGFVEYVAMRTSLRYIPSVSVSDASLMFRAFADERRLRILHLLRDEEMCVADIVEVLDLPQSTVSRQLAILRDAGLIGCREDGLWRHYAVVKPSSPLHRHLIACLGQCFAHVPELKKDAAQAKALRVRGGCCPDRETIHGSTKGARRSRA